jgi:hypothetical protein
VNDVRTVAELEQALKTAEPELLQPAALNDIRTRGRRRRRTRLAATAGGAAAAVVLASLVASGITGGGDAAHDPTPVVADHTELSPLAKRALAEIPGAQQVSAWQVVIPTPVGVAMGVPPDQPVPDHLVDAGPVDVGARRYTGVTSYDREAFPAWLWDGAEHYEKHVLGSEEEGYPVGSTEVGIVLDAGPLDLACIRPLPEWTELDPDTCSPAMLGSAGGHLSYAWGMGSDDFLQPGKDLELFHTASFSSGSARTVWIGGTDGTDVASVDLVTTDGTSVTATVASGTLVPGDTMFWGTVDGELAMAITRDASGKVLEKHVLEPCSSPTDCEVR